MQSSSFGVGVVLTVKKTNMIRYPKQSLGLGHIILEILSDRKLEFVSSDSGEEPVVGSF
jgi:hypothetical protein